MKQIEYNNRVYKANAEKVGRDRNRIMHLSKQPGMFDFDKIKNRHKSEIGYVVAPGPSFDLLPHDMFANKLIFAVNSAGFLVDPTYWVVDEGEYAEYLTYYANAITGRTFTMSLRACWRFMKNINLRKGNEKLFENMSTDIAERYYKTLYLYRLFATGFLEEALERFNGRTTLCAIGIAQWVGCKCIYLIGADFGRYNGKPYATGVPKKPINCNYDYQLKYFREFDFAGKGINVVAVNPIDHKLPFPTITPEEFLNG